ncbi:hypothetical protein [Treponema sp. C6A8]|uniref:hypothetical protein n=1 Tax=Treponema sp. C6A8 TaxID=1410609 RepID=UPI000687D056|nr:hypothetical protein [Treponema sp. C6A8]
MKKIIFATAAFLFSAALFAQEALKSTEEEYYDFLSLQGIVERPTLGYRTLSDSEWKFIEETVNVLDENGNPLLDEEGNPVTTKVLPSHPWQNNNLGKKYTLWQSQNQGKNWFTRGYDHNIKCKVYGPEWFNSYNTAAPYGQNDGALWQGKGYNSSLTGGARFEMYGFEVTLKPQLSFSQNLSFEMMTSVYPNQYGYYWGYGLDAPQRFGDAAFWTFDWGDSEFRYTWRSFSLGAGTQALWLGPSQYNPILHSNNAPTYPKFDIGLRKTKVFLPFCNWYIGDIESRIWMGYLTESSFFDNNSSNDHNRINGFTFSYNPSFIPGLSFGVTKVCISKWNSFDIRYLNPFYDSNSGIGEEIGEDQKMSCYIDLIIPRVGLELYGELGLDDYLQGGWIEGLTRYPFDTLIWTAGLKKSITFSKKKNIYGEVIFEYSDMELARNKVSAKAAYCFNMHHQVTQGYTNKGQYIGSALANGGNSQTLSFSLIYPKGKSSILLQRANPDNTYSYINLNNENQTYKGFYIIGLENLHYFLPSFTIKTGIAYQHIVNSKYFTYDSENKVTSTETLHNAIINLTFAYNF